jgi:DNA-binding Lrp family transcriptional regulator
MTRRAFDPRGRGTSYWVTAVRERVFKNPTEKLMMMVLCDYIDHNDECWPGNLTLAPDVGVDPRTIKRALARLQKEGVIERFRRQTREDQGGRRTDAIRFSWEGFQRLPLVKYEMDKLSPKGPTGSKDRRSGLGDNSSGGLGDNSSGGLGDPEDRVRGSSNREVRGQTEDLSSFRTPLEPPKNPAASRPRKKPPQLTPETTTPTAIVQTWWDETTPTPVASFIGVVKLVERFLTAGWTEEQVSHALRTAAAPTAPAMTFVMNKRGFQPAGTDPAAEAAQRWLEEHAGGDDEQGVLGGE